MGEEEDWTRAENDSDDEEGAPGGSGGKDKSRKRKNDQAEVGLWCKLDPSSKALAFKL